jgi:hypothetical protein
MGQVYNFRSGCMQTMHLLPGVAIQPNLELKTRPKPVLGSLPLTFALPECGRAVTSQREREREMRVHATLSPTFSLTVEQGVRTLFTGQRERGRKREGGREREIKRKRERGRKREGERERIVIFLMNDGCLGTF